MMRHLKSWIICGVLGFTSLNAVAIDIASRPVFLNPPDPRVMLLVSRDHELSKKAYNDYSDVNQDGILDITYNDEIDYFGYFDSFRCYTYTNSRFEPASAVTGTTGHKCSDAWSGNLLNWASMTRLDVLRKTLYGGYRSTDEVGNTVLERALLPDDTHAFAKVFSAPAGTTMSDFVPSAYSAYTALSFCNVTNASSGFSRDTTVSPKIILAGGAYPRWAMTEAPQCATGSGDRPGSTLATLIARVAVCVGVKPEDNEDNCTEYGTNYKPTGLLQKYGQSDAVSRVQFGLITGSYSKNKSGGVLRKNIGLLSGNTNTSNDEINTATGQFINQGATDAGIINTLSRIRISGWDYGGSGVHRNGCDSPGLANFNDGECVDWGNPLAEMYLESLRYFAGKTEPTPAFDSTNQEQVHLPQLPKVVWSDPLPQREWCAMSSTVVVSTGLNSFDADQLSNDLGINADDLTNAVGSREGISGSYLIGGNGTTTDGQCSPKNLSNLASARGICPEVPALMGGYHIAGLAFANLNVDLRPGYAANRERRWGSKVPSPRLGYAARQPLTTYTVSVGESLPRLEIPVGNQTVTFLPACMSNSNGTAGQNSTGWRACSLNDMRFVSLTTDSSGRPTSGTIEVSWEDSTWGNDYDMDGIQEIEFSTASGSLVLSSRVLRSSAGFALRFGYTVTGSSNDGTFFPLLEPGGTFRSTPSAWTTAASYSAGSSSAALLRSPLWYAAKYGRNEGMTLTETLTKLDNTSGNPDNYFRVTNPADLLGALGSVFEEAAAADGSASAIASNSTRLDTDTHVYQALFKSPAWSGELFAIPLSASGVPGVNNSSWEAGSLIPKFDQRKIFTWNGGVWNTGAGSSFTWAGLTNPATTAGTQQNLLGSEDVLNYLRGDQSKELDKTGGTFRRRDTLLGDIVNSDPHYVAAESFGYDQPGSGLPETERLAYTTFLTTKASRTPMLYVGANDGMLHAINASNTQADGGGVEVFGYVPNAVIPNLKDLANPDYVHRYYVDGPPNAGDAYLGGGWKTVLVSALGAGGKGLFALDITNPGSFDASKVIWEYTDSAAPGDLGFVMHRPQIARMNDGHWYAVFGNGYNSTNQKAILYFVPLDRSSNPAGVHKVELDKTTGGDNGLSEPALLDVNGDRIIDYIYAGDLKGNLWKVDVSNGSRDKWGSAYSGSGQTPEPLFVAKRTANDATRQPITGALEIGRPPPGSSGYMIYFGTGRYLGNSDIGDLSVQTIYAILDTAGNKDNIKTNLGRDALQAQSFVFEGQRTSTDASLVRVASNTAVNYTGQSPKRGWYLDLVSPNAPAARGERVVSFPLLRHGRVIFTSVVPSPDPCAQGGYSWITELDAISGARLTYSVFDYTGDGLFNQGDYASYSGNSNPVSSKHLDGQGLIKSPTVISAGEKEYKVGSGTAGGVIVIDEKGMEGAPRSSWRQILAR